MPSATTDSFGLYLKEISRYPLLTPEQEIAYAHLVQAMMRIEESRQFLTQKLNRQPTNLELSNYCEKSEDEICSIERIGHKARDTMVTANLRLVVMVAKKFQNRNLEFLDLIQEGTLGLCRGVEKFDPSKGYKLSTYAYWWIVQSITRAIAQTSRSIRLPIHINEKLNKLKKAQRELSQSLGRRPKISEIASNLGCSSEKVREYLQFSQHTVSLDLRVGEDQETVLGDLLADESSISEAVDRKLLRDNLDEMLDVLTPMQREVVSLRYGVNNSEGHTLQEVGKRNNLGKERIRQIEMQAIALLRNKHSDIR